MYIYVYNTGKIRPLGTVEEYYIYRETKKKAHKLMTGAPSQTIGFSTY
jgi:hypothetical protein